MILAKLEDRKNQTRRTTGLSRPKGDTSQRVYVNDDPDKYTPEMVVDLVKCPYGVVGDHLWSKETWKPDPSFGYPQRTKPTELDHGTNILYRATLETSHPKYTWQHWRPSLFMCRWMSRITNEIVGIRVERLQDISAEDAKAEGVSWELMQSILSPAAARQKTKPEHWVHGGDESVSYCYKCCKKEVKRRLKEQPDREFQVAGGCGNEGDSTPFCDKCGVMLENTLTNEGASMEFDHFMENGCGQKCPIDAYCLLEAMREQSWEPTRWPGTPDYQWRETLERCALMHRLAYRVLWESINGPESWDLNPYVWVLTTKRVEAA